MKKRTYQTNDSTVTVKAQRSESYLSAELTPDGEDATTVTLQGEFVPTKAQAGLWRVEGGARHRIAGAKERNGTVWAAVDGRVYRFSTVSDDGGGAAAVTENMVAAPMPGNVIKVFVKVGDTVDEGAPVLIVEAMKMEYTLRAPLSGEIVSLSCSEGDQVDANVPLVEIQ
ncbi:MAG TPA: biotin/lipoyl-binding protein [Bacteroidetes bacterium]|nr:2-oxoglutarate carboxylase large subunit [bacterium BMS3Bbin04]HDO66315.1 biotin/lipoyl-binding protein [Bacteroidota bacterium]HEX05440.1 biotin/lipoyl-binding protein [Bacteroidota bacterium]